MVNWNEANAKISPGMLIESLVICIICGRRPLWKVEQFWERQDLKLLFDGVDVTYDQLNDDAYGRGARCSWTTCAEMCNKTQAVS
jgi:hypothetical protein